MSELLLDAAGRRRSPVRLPQFHAGRSPRNKGMRYPADPPTVEEIVAVMRRAGDRVHGHRLRGLIIVLWRAGLRIHEALALAEADLDQRRGSLLVRRGKGGRRREVGMDDWAWEQLLPWLDTRVELPVGPLFCVVNGPTRGRPWSPSAARSELRRTAREAGVRRRFAPHQLRHAHAVEMAREGVPLIVIQRQLGHTAKLHCVSDAGSEHPLVDVEVEHAITEVIGGRVEAFAADLADFGSAYGALARDDHRRFVDAFRNGMIPGLPRD